MEFNYLFIKYKNYLKAKSFDWTFLNASILYYTKRNKVKLIILNFALFRIIYYKFFYIIEWIFQIRFYLYICNHIFFNVLIISLKNILTWFQ